MREAGTAFSRHRKRFAGTVLALGLTALTGHAQSSFQANVVVIADSSESMRTNDPGNAAVLVSRLFADIVPGRFAVVRLVDATQDGSQLGGKNAGRQEPCRDNPKKTCNIMMIDPDLLRRKAEGGMFALIRPAQRDATFKQRLDSHLNPSASGSDYAPSFLSARKILGEGVSPDVPRSLILLTDGVFDDWAQEAKVIATDLKQSGALVQPIVFHGGNDAQLKEIGLKDSEIDKVDGSPRSIIKAFAQAFRRVVQAPYRVDKDLANDPTFDMKPRVEEAWVVVYGDDTLGAVQLFGPGVTKTADFATDSHHGYTYRVAFLSGPPAGKWSLKVKGGGRGTAFAVIQRSAIVPVLDAPPKVNPGIPFPVTVTLHAGAGGPVLKAGDLPEAVKVTLQIDGRTVELKDNGDGKYTAAVQTQSAGTTPLRVRAFSEEFLDRSVSGSVFSEGSIAFDPRIVEIDIGTNKAGTAICRPIPYHGSVQGSPVMELRIARSLPPGYSLEWRSASGSHRTGVSSALRSGEAVNLCVVTDSGAPELAFDGATSATWQMAGTSAASGQLELRLRGTIIALTWWERWWRVLLLILFILAVITFIYGFIKPNRFSRSLCIVVAAEQGELDQLTPVSVRTRRGVRIGWYRDARACIHPDFKVNGTARGAAALLRAGQRGFVSVVGHGSTVFREASDQWDAIGEKGRHASMGDTYRISEQGPFFRLVSRGIKR